MDFGYKDKPLYSVYAHMSKIIALPGQHVETGDVLGLVGATGATTGPHVHFEVRWGKNSFQQTYNPELWMAPPGRLGRSGGTHHGLLETSRSRTSWTSMCRIPLPEQVHLVRTYGGDPANSDPYYNENMAIGDLPAGLYKVTFQYRKG